MPSPKPFGARPVPPPPVANPEFVDAESDQAPLLPPPPGPNATVQATPPPPTTPAAWNAPQTTAQQPQPPEPQLRARPQGPPQSRLSQIRPLPGVTPPERDAEEAEAVDSELAEQVRNVGVRATRLRLAFTGLCFVVAGLAIAAIWWASDRPETTTPEDVGTAIEDAFAETTVPEPVGPAVYNALIPSMVLIQVGEGTDISVGTGVVISDEAQIMTAFHVVDGEGPISIMFTDGTSTTATIVEAQPEIDIAVLTVEQPPQVLVPAVLGGGVQIGEPVFALGNPLGFGGSFSEGIVSGLGRSLPVNDDLTLEDLIQFDAAVNPGSSGGPLINRAGQVVGIVTALASPTGEEFFAGIGFAVPIQTAGGAAGGPQQ